MKEDLEGMRIWKEGGFGRKEDMEEMRIWNEGGFGRKKGGFGKKT